LSEPTGNINNHMSRATSISDTYRAIGTDFGNHHVWDGLTWDKV
jgi:hypothetical protein